MLRGFLSRTLPRIVAPYSSQLPIRHVHQSRVLLGLEEFFEHGKALPPFDTQNRPVYGRAWTADELRIKSFEDLHKLWFVLLKELNLLSTQKNEARRIGQRWFGQARVDKVQYSLAGLEF